MFFMEGEKINEIIKDLLNERYGKKTSIKRRVVLNNKNLNKPAERGDKVCKISLDVEIFDINKKEDFDRLWKDDRKD